jgi:hypothetical protein
LLLHLLGCLSHAPPRVSISCTSSGCFHYSSRPSAPPWALGSWCLSSRSHSRCTCGTRASHVDVVLVEIVAFPLAWCQNSALIQCPSVLHYYQLSHDNSFRAALPSGTISFPSYLSTTTTHLGRALSCGCQLSVKTEPPLVIKPMCFVVLAPPPPPPRKQALSPCCRHTCSLSLHHALATPVRELFSAFAGLCSRSPFSVSATPCRRALSLSSTCNHAVAISLRRLRCRAWWRCMVLSGGSFRSAQPPGLMAPINTHRHLLVLLHL